MPHIPLRYAPRLIWYGTRNFFTNRPLIISFEVTLACNANCKHCDLGGGIPGEKRIAPEKYRQYIEEFHPVVVQLSGGEPLLRQDLLDIIKAIKINYFFPYTILVSNGWALTKDKYLKYKCAGVNQFSISLDFPDERHDKFRGINGLFKKLNSLIPELAALGHGDVVLNTAITRENIKELPAIVETAKNWGVCISFSVYTPLRTGDYSLTIESEKDLQFAKEIFLKCKKKIPPFDRIVNSHYNLDGLLKFMHDKNIPHCSAGKRFMVVRPDGLLNPCSLQRTNYKTQKEMVEYFSSKNDCGGCYVSIRSYVEISFPKLLWENISMRVLNFSRS